MDGRSRSAKVFARISALLISKIRSHIVEAGHEVLYPPVIAPALPAGSFLTRLRRLLKVCVPSFLDRDAARYAILSMRVNVSLLGLAAIVLLRVSLSDRIAHLNGRTVQFLLQQDLGAFKRLVLIR